MAESFVVVEGQDFTANCSNPSGTVGISYVVNGDIGGGNYSSRVQSLIGTPQLNRFVFYNVTRTDDGTNFSCSTVNDGGNPFLFGNGTIRVICEFQGDVVPQTTIFISHFSIIVIFYSCIYYAYI